jgi:hypothetical protein
VNVCHFVENFSFKQYFNNNIVSLLAYLCMSQCIAFFLIIFLCSDVFCRDINKNQWNIAEQPTSKESVDIM